MQALAAWEPLVRTPSCGVDCCAMSMKMRQSLDEFEQAYYAQLHADRRRQDAAIKRTEQRQRTRIANRTNRHGTLRFVLLVLAMIATAVIVTVIMFRTLYVVMG